MSFSYKPRGPVTLTEAQILALHQKLRDMRHDVNGRLANIAAAAELMRLRPGQSVEERLKLLLEQPHQAAESIASFSREFEALFGLKRE
jgi:NifU-like protein involved in Fe-S cluster formation